MRHQISQWFISGRSDPPRISGRGKVPTPGTPVWRTPVREDWVPVRDSFQPEPTGSPRGPVIGAETTWYCRRSRPELRHRSDKGSLVQPISFGLWSVVPDLISVTRDPAEPSGMPFVYPDLSTRPVSAGLDLGISVFTSTPPLSLFPFLRSSP